MREMTPNRWAPTFLMSLIFLISLAFTNCSDVGFQQGDDASAKAAGGAEQPVEVIDTEGMDGEVLDEENTADIEDEIKRRRDRKETEIVFTDAENCGPNTALICHVPSGNISAMHEICVGIPALGAHVGVHGDHGMYDMVGKCPENFKIGISE